MTSPKFPLADALKGKVAQWREQGYPGTTDTTQELLSYWFDRPEDEPGFYPCQREAIETLIYCHEVLKTPTPFALYHILSPQSIETDPNFRREVERTPYPKYCFKMATGSGKTWVLAMALIWQYFNTIRGEPGAYSGHFLVVAPGLTVRDRLIDSFLGKKDSQGNRMIKESDYYNPLFIPGRWFNDFRALEVLTPEDMHPNMSYSQSPFVLVANWHKFLPRKGGDSVWKQVIGADVEEQDTATLYTDFLSSYPDLVIFNDEAHHIHRIGEEQDVKWQEAIERIRRSIQEAHQDRAGTFLQVDLSATPFYGTGEKKEYFPHIVYDYDLVQAEADMLVKQLFLEERGKGGEDELEGLDFRALRDSEGKAHALSPGQKTMIHIGLGKLDQLEREFEERGLDKKPVLFILAEDTTVARLVEQYLADLVDPKGRPYRGQILSIHEGKRENLSDEAWKKLRDDVFNIDLNERRILISVLMLREGFDVRNIAVTVVLRSTESDILLEQVVGRGLRPMFNEPEYQDAKREAFRQIRDKEQPSNSLDFLFIVEHPRFRKFYEALMEQGHAIGTGDSSKTVTPGDLVTVEALASRIPEFDLAWPQQFLSEGKAPDLSRLNIDDLPVYATPFDTLKHMTGLAITDVHISTEQKVKTWYLDNEYFDYGLLLRSVTEAVTRTQARPFLTGSQEDIMALVDKYVSSRLFGETIDFAIPENYRVLNYREIYEFVVNQVRLALVNLVGGLQFETEEQARWLYLSEVPSIKVRLSKSVETQKSIYPRLPFPAHAGGFEQAFMETMLETSAEVLAYCKPTRRHPFTVRYLNERGILQGYLPDFVVKGEDKMYIAETKADRDKANPDVLLKARAAIAWCESASRVEPPLDQPQEWQYILISESNFNANRNLSFGALLPHAEQELNRLFAAQAGRLF